MKRLVLRENTWITLFGLPFGVLVGFGLLSVILIEATTADLEIRLLVSAGSIVVGCALMLAFTLFVNNMMGRKFKGIDMVASLKRVE